MIVNITFQVADSINFLAILGFLGFGLNYPQVDWGDMLSGGLTYLQDGYWWLVYPVGICLVLVVMAFNFIGDALRDTVDVRHAASLRFRGIVGTPILQVGRSFGRYHALALGGASGRQCQLFDRGGRDPWPGR